MSGYGIPFAPASGSTFAPAVDALFFALLAFALGLGAFLTCLVVGYAVRYRAGAKVEREAPRRRDFRLEIAWTSASLVVAFGLFAWGAVLFEQERRPPADALVIAGVGKQWMWKFRHPGGQREINELHLPVGQPIVVSLASEDVIHSFYVPAFRKKHDVVPGRDNRIWFTISKAGRYRLFCAEYCGTQHSKMGGWIVAMPPEDYAGWLEAQGESESLAAAGERLFRALGCSGCHGVSTRVRAPDLAGIFGRPVAVAEGPPVVADARYIRDSILRPKQHIAAGYEPVMPSFDGLIDEAELQELVAYVASLGEAEPMQPTPTEPGR